MTSWLWIASTIAEQKKWPVLRRPWQVIDRVVTIAAVAPAIPDQRPMLLPLLVKRPMIRQCPLSY